MKRLTVTYNGLTLVDDDVTDFNLSESGEGVKVEGRFKVADRPAASGSAGSLLSALAGASKAAAAKKE